MIDLDKAAQAAEALGWEVSRDNRGVYAETGSCNITIWGDGDVAIHEEERTFPSITDIAPLIAAWAALVQEGTDANGT